MSLDRKEENKNSSDAPVKVFKPLLNNQTYYSFSMNPKCQYEESSSRYIDLYSSVVSFFKQHHATDYAELDLNTEVSYPLKNGIDKRKSNEVISRIHFHGTIRFLSVVHWYIYVQPFLAGFCIYEIDTISNMDTWNNYITKDSVQWSIVDVPFTNYNINTSVILGSKVKKKKQDAINNGIPVISDDDAPFYIEKDDIITQLQQTDCAICYNKICVENGLVELDDNVTLVES